MNEKDYLTVQCIYKICSCFDCLPFERSKSKRCDQSQCLITGSVKKCSWKTLYFTKKITQHLIYFKNLPRHGTHQWMGNGVTISTLTDMGGWRSWTPTHFQQICGIFYSLMHRKEQIMHLHATRKHTNRLFVHIRSWHIEKSNVKLSHLHVGLYTMDASIVLQNARQVSALVYSLFNVHHGIDPGIRFDELLSNAYLSTVIPHVEGLEHGVHLTHLTRSHLQKAHNKIQNYNSFIRCFCDLHCLFHLLQARMLRFWKRKGTKTFSSCTQWGNC